MSVVRHPHAWTSDNGQRTTALLAILALLLAAPLYAGRVYVANERAGTIQVIDTVTDTIIGSRKLADRPRGVEVHNGRVYVAVSWWRDKPRVGRERIAVLDRALKPIRDYACGRDPERVATDGKRLYVTNEDPGTASIIDLATAKTLATLIVGTEPEGVAVSPDGRWCYVTGESSNTITVIDTKAMKVTAAMIVDPRPRFTVFSPDGKRAWASAEVGGTISVIDTAHYRVTQHLRITPADHPVGLALSLNAKRLYAATGRGNAVAVLDTTTNKVLARIPVDNRPWGITITRDGKKVYVGNSLSNTVSVIDTASLRVIKTIKTDDGPWGLAAGE